MRPAFHRSLLWAYPMYAGIGASFGYWLTGVEDNQLRILSDTRDRLLEKRRRRAEREALRDPTESQKLDESIFASPTAVVQGGYDVPAGQVETTP